MPKLMLKTPRPQRTSQVYDNQAPHQETYARKIAIKVLRDLLD